ncbi:hypothetical protein [Chitinasiproducens palmae]|uniref:Uncharacterized protein n=1 Tax=Chitinasiproducens palmae TaxID=1770053 RepID=A0A1H2PT92_9BURK|nr:hypothetical protein [Chitinasiproducens palmae]SDV50326.1 hypothetical protein SAMN05216551_11198 [Chitinasiproducens palmae]
MPTLSASLAVALRSTRDALAAADAHAILFLIPKIRDAPALVARRAGLCLAL